MSNATLAAIIIPIVAGICLAVWLVLVMINSNRRPASHGRGEEPRQPVVGGIVHGDPRQMTADPDVPASGDITAPRAPNDHTEGG